MESEHRLASRADRLADRSRRIAWLTLAAVGLVTLGTAPFSGDKSLDVALLPFSGIFLAAPPIGMILMAAVTIGASFAAASGIRALLLQAESRRDARTGMILGLLALAYMAIQAFVVWWGLVAFKFTF